MWINVWHNLDNMWGLWSLFLLKFVITSLFYFCLFIPASSRLPSLNSHLLNMPLKW